MLESLQKADRTGFSSQASFDKPDTSNLLKFWSEEVVPVLWKKLDMVKTIINDLPQAADPNWTDEQKLSLLNFFVHIEGIALGISWIEKRLPGPAAQVDNDHARWLDQAQHTLDTPASTNTTEASNQPDSDSAKGLNT
jgi:hypothetical protein